MFRKVYTGVFLTPKDLQKVNDWIRDAVERSIPSRKKTLSFSPQGLPLADPLQAPPDAMRTVIEHIHTLILKKYGLPRRDKIVYGVEPTGEIIYLIPDNESPQEHYLQYDV